MRSGLVSDVIPGSGFAPDTVNVAAGGGDGVPGVLCGMPVQPGDTVWIEEYGGTWRVVFNASRKVYGGTAPTIEFGNSPPAGARQLATLYDATGADGVPHLFGVYSTPPPTPTPATVFVPTVSRTYDPTNGWDLRSDEVRQGNYPGIGAATGCWFFGDIPAALAGATPTAAAVRVVRDGRGGKAGPVAVRLALHAAAGPVGGPPSVVTAAGGDPLLSWGATADIPLPADWVAALVSGSAKGVCVTSTSTSDYAIFRGAASGSGTLSFS